MTDIDFVQEFCKTDLLDMSEFYRPSVIFRNAAGRACSIVDVSLAAYEAGEARWEYLFFKARQRFKESRLVALTEPGLRSLQSVGPRSADPAASQTSADPAGR